MTVTKVTERSWKSRVGDSFKGMLCGAALVVAAIAGLFWNEGRTIKQANALKEGAQNVVSVDSETVDPANEGKLIHISGNAATQDVLRDDYFGFEVNAIKLARKVEIYQWEETSESHTERTSGGGEKTTTTYSYSKTWSEDLIDSSSFQESGHDNPVRVPVMSSEFYAQNVSLGAFRLPENIVKKLNAQQNFDPRSVLVKEEPATLEEPTDVPATPETPADADVSATPETPADADVSATPETTAVAEATQSDETSGDEATDATEAPTDGAESVPSAFNVAPTNVRFAGSVAIDDYDEYGLDETSVNGGTNANEKREDGFFFDQGGYYRGTPDIPQVGDIRVTFTIVPASTEASVVSQQSKDTFVPYQAKTGQVQLVRDGLASAEQMFADAQSANKTLGWLIRLAGFIVMVIGFSLLTKPMEVLADFVPFLASVVGFITTIGAFVISLCLTLITISVGWLAYRPFVAVPLLVLSVGALIWRFTKKKNGLQQPIKGAEPQKAPDQNNDDEIVLVNK